MIDMQGATIDPVGSRRPIHKGVKNISHASNQAGTQQHLLF